MSPQIYGWVYGARTDDVWFVQRWATRYGGWRPTVFLATGLELGMWMTAATLLGFALWYCGSVKRVMGIRSGVLVCILAVTAVACRATGALLLLFGGLGMLIFLQRIRRPWPILLLLAVPVTYLPVRALGLNDGSQLVYIAGEVFGSHRAQSLEFRFQNEELLVARAWQSPWFGWGGWGRERVYDEYGKDISIVDGKWILFFGLFGLPAVIAFYIAFCTAPTLACFRFIKQGWRWRDVYPTVAVCLLLLLYMIDCLLNAMDNSIYSVCLGAVTTLTVLPNWRLAAAAEEITHGASSPAVRRLWPPPAPPVEVGEPVASTK